LDIFSSLGKRAWIWKRGFGTLFGNFKDEAQYSKVDRDDFTTCPQIFWALWVSTYRSPKGVLGRWS
tara:strand:- start:2082 stop:2279 length:198 start_codon:yes stop_codon:yes gene_type:complete